jgi:ABC-2 type transport system permease protein
MTPMEVNPHSGNWLGLWTLYTREVRRFIKVYTQTLIAPLVTTLLFFAVFSLALGEAVRTVWGVPFLEFLAPGLVMMAITQNAFANTSSSLVISKVQGNIVDTLMPPLSAHELTFAYAMGGTTRGLVIGSFIILVMSFFVPMGMDNFFLVLYHGFMGALMLSLFGILGGIWSEKFDHMAAVTNFIVTPLSFLSGTFYSIDRLPETAVFLAHINPFFYMIDGFRAGFIGQSDSPIIVGVLVMAGVNFTLWVIAYRLFKTGYKLKA